MIFSSLTDVTINYVASSAEERSRRVRLCAEAVATVQDFGGCSIEKRVFASYSTFPGGAMGEFWQV